MLPNRHRLVAFCPRPLWFSPSNWRVFIAPRTASLYHGKEKRIFPSAMHIRGRAFQGTAVTFISEEGPRMRGRKDAP